MAHFQLIDRVLSLSEDVLTSIETDMSNGLSCTRIICSRVIAVSDLLEAVSSLSVDEKLSSERARRFNAIEARQIAILQEEGQIKKRKKEAVAFQKERKRTKV